MDITVKLLQSLGFNINDFQVDCYTVGGKVYNACRCTHLPTGIVVQSQAHNSYVENALAVIEEMLYRLQK